MRIHHRPGPVLTAVLLACTVAAFPACRGDEDPTPEPPAAAACDDPSPAGFCAAPADGPCTPTDDPVEFPACNDGSGLFGEWGLDRLGHPAFRYTWDDPDDPRAEWRLSDRSTRRDHFTQIGNDRLIAWVNADGHIELFGRDRGPVIWNRVDPEHGRFAGGFGYIIEDDTPWVTAHAHRPRGATSERVWGTGYVRTLLAHDGIEVLRTTRAPFGDHTYLLDTVRITNTSDRSRTLRHIEFRDVNHHALELQLVRWGGFGSNVLRNLDRERNRINQHFTLHTHTDGTTACLVHEWTGAEEPSPPPSARSYAPPTLCLQRVLDGGGVHAGHILSREDFITGSRVRDIDPQHVETTPPPAVNALDQPRVLGDAIDFALAPGESATLRYAFGWHADAPDLAHFEADFLGAEEDRIEAYEHERWRAVMPSLAIDGDGALQREMAWHAWHLFAGGAQDDYYGVPLLVQGGAYQVLHGLDGAARDYALYAIPAVYLRPETAANLLRMIMRMTYADGHQISYATQGYGLNEGAGIHNTPSDLDLFFLLALNEYLIATGDTAFLDERNPRWPKDAEPPVPTLDHARAAIRHLIDVVGTGPNGLIRVRTGDWSDGITWESPDRSRTVQEGESIPNSQMALWVLPRTAGWLAEHDPDLAGEVLVFVESLQSAVDEQWTGQWYRRAWWHEGAPFGDDFLDLEAQIWALIAGLPSPDQRDALLASLDELSSPEAAPFGTPIRMDGEVWHAIAGLLTWGFTAHDPERAVSHLRRHTMRSAANTLPEQWFGVWSGPDALLRHGGTWSSEVTPMTDFPIGNLNQHALPLIAALRVAGIAPAPDGRTLRIAPVAPLSLRTTLLDVFASSEETRVVWRGGEGVELDIAPYGDGAAVLER